MGVVHDAKAAELSIPVPVKRKPYKRKVIASAVGSAAEMIGDLERGVEVCGLTNGQFSMIDMLEHILNQVGPEPADCTISTWTMGIYDQSRAADFVVNGRIRSIRWIVDPSLFGRRPELAGRLVEAFGADSFRTVNTHAKWATVRNSSWAVCVRSSMNLNPNKRLENFDISESPELTAFFEGIVTDVFGRFDPEDNGRTQSYAFFADVLEKYEAIRRDPSSPFSGLEDMTDAFAGYRTFGA